MICREDAQCATAMKGKERKERKGISWTSTHNNHTYRTGTRTCVLSNPSTHTRQMSLSRWSLPNNYSLEMTNMKSDNPSTLIHPVSAERNGKDRLLYTMFENCYESTNKMITCTVSFKVMTMKERSSQ